MVLSLIFLCVVAALPGDFFKHGEIYRQLPLYCFLEKKALQEENGQDRETEMLLQEKNAEHLGEEVEAENRKEQETLLMAEAEEVEKKAYDLMMTGKPGGHYIFACSDYLEIGTPLENVKALLRGARAASSYE